MSYDPYAWGAPGGPPPEASPAWMELPTDRPPPRWGIGDVALGLLAWVIASIVFAIPAIVASDGSGEITGIWAVVALAGSWTGMVGWVLYASRRKGSGTLARDFGFRFRWIDPLVGLAAGFVTLVVTGVAARLIGNLAGEAPADNTEAIFGGQEGNSVGLVLLGIGAAIGAPIVEELFFRGLTLRAIERRFGAAAGVIASSALFGLLHFQPGSWVTMVTLVLVIGSYAVVFALLTRSFGRLGPSIFAHMTINGISVAVLVYTTLRI
jgi:membrane protease YdiL (CAAX protease family)